MAHPSSPRTGSERADTGHGRGAKEDVVNIVRDLRGQGVAIVVVSTEPETVLSLADRIVVMKKGSVVREFADELVSKDRLMEAA